MHGDFLLPYIPNLMVSIFSSWYTDLKKSLGNGAERILPVGETKNHQHMQLESAFPILVHCTLSKCYDINIYNLQVLFNFTRASLYTLVNKLAGFFV